MSEQSSPDSVLGVDSVGTDMAKRKSLKRKICEALSLSPAPKAKERKVEKPRKRDTQSVYKRYLSSDTGFQVLFGEPFDKNENSKDTSGRRQTDSSKPTVSKKSSKGNVTKSNASATKTAKKGVKKTSKMKPKADSKKSSKGNATKSNANETKSAMKGAQKRSKIKPKACDSKKKAGQSKSKLRVLLPATKKINKRTNENIDLPDDVEEDRSVVLAEIANIYAQEFTEKTHSIPDFCPSGQNATESQNQEGGSSRPVDSPETVRESSVARASWNAGVSLSATNSRDDTTGQERPLDLCKTKRRQGRTEEHVYEYCMDNVEAIKSQIDEEGVLNLTSPPVPSNVAVLVGESPHGDPEGVSRARDGTDEDDVTNATVVSGSRSGRYRLLCGLDTDQGADVFTPRVEKSSPLDLTHAPRGEGRRLSSDTTVEDFAAFEPLSESTKDGYDIPENETADTEIKEELAGADALKQLTDELTSLNEDSSFISTPIHKRHTPRNVQQNDSSVTPKKTRKSQRKAASVLLETPGKGAKSPRTPSKCQTGTRKSPRKKTPKTDGLSPDSREPKNRLLTPILKKGGSAETSGVNTQLHNASKSMERSVSFSVKSKRRRPISKLRRGRALKFSVKDMVAEATQKKRNGSSKAQSPSRVNAKQHSPSSSVARSLSSSVPYDTEDSLLSECEDRLEIMEDDGDESWEDESDDAEEKRRFRNPHFDNAIRRKSIKYNVTFRNVKSIIHEIIKNEHFSKIIRLSLEDEEGLRDQLQEAIFDTKMTRSKVKDVIEKGQFPKEWTFKALHETPKKSEWSEFLESNLHEDSTTRDVDEDDQDYDPLADEEQESDDDESIMSSQASEFGSPLSSSMVLPPTPRDMVTKRLFKQSSVAVSPARSENDEDKGPARSTRSRQPLGDKAWEELENDLMFVAPDIEPDIYDGHCDGDYADFLKSLYKGNTDLNETMDDEHNDAEFDFLGEEEAEALGQNSDDEREEYRFDKRTRISKSEMASLMDELFEAYGGSADLLDDDDILATESPDDSMSEAKTSTPGKPGSKGKPVPKVSSEGKGKGKEGGKFAVVSENGQINSNTFTAAEKYPGVIAPIVLDPTHAILMMSELVKITHKDSQNRAVTLTLTRLDQLRLQDQMSKYVQLLAQTCVQAADNADLQSVRDLSRSYLTELDVLGRKSIKNGVKETSFHPKNLAEALEVTKKTIKQDDKEVTAFIRSKLCKKNPVYKTNQIVDSCGLSYGQMDVLLHSKAFIHTHLLPLVRFHRDDNNVRGRRAVFTKSEDCLLVMAIKELERNCKHHNMYSVIHEYVMPVKTKEQLLSRYKNLKRGRIEQRLEITKAIQENAVLLVRPDINDLQTPVELLAPIERNAKELPGWFAVYTSAKRKFFTNKEKQRNDTQVDETVGECSRVTSPKKKPVKRTRRAPVSNSNLIVGESGLKSITISTPAQLKSPNNKSTPKSTPKILPQLPPSAAILLRKDISCSSVTTLDPPRYRPIYPSKEVKENKAPANPKWSPLPKSKVTKGGSRTRRPISLGTPKLPAQTVQTLSNLYSGTFISADSLQVVAAPLFIVQTPDGAEKADVTACTVVSSTAASTASEGTCVNTASSIESVSAGSGSTPVCTASRSDPGSTTSGSTPTSTASRVAPATTPSRSTPVILVPRSTAAYEGHSRTPQAANVAADGVSGLPTPVMVQLASDQEAPFNLIQLSSPKPNQGATGFQATLNTDPTSQQTVKLLEHDIEQPDQQALAETYVQTPACTLESFDFTPLTPEGPLSPQSREKFRKIVFGTPKSDKKRAEPSLIGSAMAEVVGVSPSKLGTPESLRMMGISPAKFESIVEQMKQVKSDEAKPDAKRSLSTVYDSITTVEQDSLADKATKENFQETTEKNTQATVDLQISPTPFTNASLLETSRDGPSFSKLSPVHLGMSENSSMFPEKIAENAFDTNSVLVTPKKIDFIDGSSNLGTPKVVRSLTDKLKKYGDSPSAKRFMECLDTSTKRQVLLIEELAQETVTSQAKTSLSSPEAMATPRKDTDAPQTPAKTRKVVALLEQMAHEAGSPSSSLASPPPCLNPSTPNRISGVENVEVATRVPTLDDSPDDMPSISDATGLASIGRLFDDRSQGSPARSTTKFRPILPQGTLSPPKKSPIIERKQQGKAPKRKLLQTKARNIAPKGFVLAHAYVSPVKQAAAAISAKAKNYCSPTKNQRGRYRPIAPKTPTPPRSSKRRIFSPPPVSTQGSEREIGDNTGSENEQSDNYSSEVTGGMMMTRRQHHLRKKRRLPREQDGVEKPLIGDADVIQDADNDSQEEDGDEDLARLIEASTTVRFDPRQQDGGQQKSKGQIKKDTMIEMLAPDLIEADALTDERDTAYAQQYMNKVKETFSHDKDKYCEFLRILHEFGKNKNSPVQLYNDLSALFTGHEELMEEFAAFLLPAQARECGCFMLHQEYIKARSFLRKLEVHFKKLPGMLQRVLTAFGKWETLPTKNVKDLQAEIKPLLKGQQYLLDEFSTFFGDERVPESHMTDFEEITLPGSSDEDESDSCEEVVIPDEGDTTYGTRACRCPCHAQPGLEEYQRRSKHCLSCGVKIIRGRMYLCVEDKLRPVDVKPHTPLKASQGEEEEDDLSLSDIDVEEEEEEVKELEAEGEPEETNVNGDTQHDILDDDDEDDDVIASEEELEEVEENEEADDTEEPEVADDACAADIEDQDGDAGHDMLDDESEVDFGEDDKNSQGGHEAGSDAEGDADTSASRDVSEVGSPGRREDLSPPCSSQGSSTSLASSRVTPIPESQAPPISEGQGEAAQGSIDVSDASKELTPEKKQESKATSDTKSSNEGPGTGTHDCDSNTGKDRLRHGTTAAETGRRTKPRRVAFTTLQTDISPVESTSFGEYNVMEFITSQQANILDSQHGKSGSDKRNRKKACGDTPAATASHKRKQGKRSEQRDPSEAKIKPAPCDAVCKSPVDTADASGGKTLNNRASLEEGVVCAQVDREMTGEGSGPQVPHAEGKEGKDTQVPGDNKGRYIQVTQPGDSEVRAIQVPQPRDSEVRDIQVPQSGDNEFGDIQVPQPRDSEVRDIQVPQSGDNEFGDIQVPQPRDSEVRDIQVPQPGDNEFGDIQVPQPRDSEVRDIQVPQPGGNEFRVIQVPKPWDNEFRGIQVPQPRDNEVRDIQVPQPGDNEFRAIKVPQPRDNEVRDIQVPQPGDKECRKIQVPQPIDEEVGDMQGSQPEEVGDMQGAKPEDMEVENMQAPWPESKEVNDIQGDNLDTDIQMPLSEGKENIYKELSQPEDKEVGDILRTNVECEGASVDRESTEISHGQFLTEDDLKINEKSSGRVCYSPSLTISTPSTLLDASSDSSLNDSACSWTVSSGDSTDLTLSPIRESPASPDPLQLRLSPSPSVTPTLAHRLKKPELSPGPLSSYSLFGEMSSSTMSENSYVEQSQSREKSLKDSKNICEMPQREKAIMASQLSAERTGKHGKAGQTSEKSALEKNMSRELHKRTIVKEVRHRDKSLCGGDNVISAGRLPRESLHGGLATDVRCIEAATSQSAEKREGNIAKEEEGVGAGPSVRNRHVMSTDAPTTVWTEAELECLVTTLKGEEMNEEMLSALVLSLPNKTMQQITAKLSSISESTS